MTRTTAPLAAGEAAELLGCKRDTLYRWLENGTLPAWQGCRRGRWYVDLQGVADRMGLTLDEARQAVRDLRNKEAS